MHTEYSNGNWIFERSRGHAGYRCLKCGHWIYAHRKIECDCDDPYNDIFDERINTMSLKEALKKIGRKHEDIDFDVWGDDDPYNDLFDENEVPFDQDPLFDE